MKRRDFLLAIAGLAAIPKLLEQQPLVIANGRIPQWSEDKRGWQLVARAWELGERTHIDRLGWCVCVQKGTDETARWQRCEPPVGIYNIRAVTA